MNAGIGVTYSRINRSAKGFELVNDGGAIVESFWNIPQAEAERVFGTGGTVPEGTIVRPYTVGTAIGAYTTVAGDLKICEAATEKFWGVTLTEVRSFGSKNNRADYPEAIGYGERVAIATGVFNAVAQNFNKNSQTIIPGRLIACGALGKPTLVDFVGGSDYLFGKVIEEGFIPTSAVDGLPVSGAVAEEILIKAYCDQR